MTGLNRMIGMTRMTGVTGMTEVIKIDWDDYGMR